MGQPGQGPGPGPGPQGDPGSDSTATSLSGAGAGAGALGLAGAGAIAGSGAFSGSDSDNWNGNENGNGNGNLNGNFDGNGNLNGNLNANLNDSTTYVDDKVSVDVSVKDSVDVGPPVNEYSGNSGSFDSTTYNVPIDLTDSPLNLAPANNFLAGSGDSFTFTGNGTDTAFHVDQVNSLVADNSLSKVSLANYGDGFSQTASGNEGGHSFAGDISGTVGDTVSAAVSSAASVTSTLSAFTQNIVLGANIQYNSLSQSVTGGGVTHTTTATAAPSDMMGHDHGPMHFSS